MFALSKLAGLAATPSNALAAFAFVGVVAAMAWPPLTAVGLKLALVALALTLLLGLGPVPSWILLPLEDRFPPEAEDERGVTGVIVLGGSVLPRISFSRGQLATGASAERVIAMADLARRHPGARVVFSGGSGSMVEEEPPEADAVERFAATLGLAPGRITYENRSRTTWENAVESRRLLDPKPAERWLLVTSAWHMPRAMGSFRKAGFAVVPYPVDYRTVGSGRRVILSTALSGGLDLLDTGVREWLGLLAYRLADQSTALFPRP